MSWVAKAFLAVPFLVLGFLSVKFFERNLQMQTPVFLTWYCLGMAIGVGALAKVQSFTLIPRPWVVVAAIAIGITIGSAANFFLFGALKSAPNEGLALSITNLTASAVFLSSLFLGMYIPSLFDSALVSIPKMIGVFLAVIATILIALF